LAELPDGLPIYVFLIISWLAMSLPIADAGKINLLALIKTIQQIEIKGIIQFLDSRKRDFLLSGRSLQFFFQVNDSSPLKSL
jgi:hypothetical protein